LVDLCEVVPGELVPVYPLRTPFCWGVPCAMSRARRAEVIDEHAAIFILQGALDRLANRRDMR
jgi:hypothetical protein